MATPRKRPEDKLKTGPPPKTEVEPVLAKAICENLELGMPLRPSAEAEGVPDTTVRRWVAEFPEFAAQVTRARAQAMKHFVVRSLGGGKGSSNAEFHLQRRFRDDYGAPSHDRDVQPGEVHIIIEGGLPKFPQEPDANNTPS